MDNNEMTRRVLRTLALAESFENALTAFSVWRYLVRDHPHSSSQTPKVTLREVRETLERLTREGVLIEENGYYTFSDRRGLCEEQLTRLQIASRKLRRARRLARLIVRLPYISGVFADGSLATGTTKEGSDLDVFIVVKAGRIFLARLIVSFFTEMLGIRRTTRHIRNRLCLNSFVTEDALALPEAFRTLHAAWIRAHMFPLALRDSDLANRFWEAQKWICDFFEEMPEGALGKGEENDRGQSQPSRDGLAIANLLERIAKALQERKIARNPLTRQSGGRIVVNDAMLLFHPGLPEERRRHLYRERLNQFGIGE
jgi:hypothetical protein